MVSYKAILISHFPINVIFRNGGSVLSVINTNTSKEIEDVDMGIENNKETEEQRLNYARVY